MARGTRFINQNLRMGSGVFDPHHHTHGMSTATTTAHYRIGNALIEHDRRGPDRDTCCDVQ